MACGPLCSAFLMIITLWGVLFLGIVGLLFQQESVGLWEDLPGVKDSEKDKEPVPSPSPGTSAGPTETPLQKLDEHIATLRDKYQDKALYTWYAAAAHGVTFILAFGRFMMVKNRL